MDKEKLEELFADVDFVKSIANVKSIEDLQKALTDKGVEISADDAYAILKLLSEESNGELSDDELEDVAGGGFWKKLGKFLKRVGRVTA